MFLAAVTSDSAKHPSGTAAKLLWMVRQVEPGESRARAEQTAEQIGKTPLADKDMHCEMLAVVFDLEERVRHGHVPGD